MTFRDIRYDPLGRLRQAGTGPVLVHAGARLMAEYTGSTMTRRHVFGPGLDEPLVTYTGATKSWHVADERGSIVAATNAAGAATATYGYGPHGEPDARGAPPRFGYTGALVMDGMALAQMRARTYSHRLGRFLQTDPIGQAGGINVYDYAGGDGVNATDPWGLGPSSVLADGTIVTDGWGTRDPRKFRDWSDYYYRYERYDAGYAAYGVGGFGPTSPTSSPAPTPPPESPPQSEGPQSADKPCNQRLLAFANGLADFGDAANRAGDAGLITAGALAVVGAGATATVVGAPVGITAGGAAAGLATSSGIVKAVGAFAAIGGEVAAAIATGNRTPIGAALFTATAAVAPFKLGAVASFFQDKVADAAGRMVGFGNTPYTCSTGG